MSFLYLIRHGERLDETDRSAWKKKLKTYEGKCKNMNHRIADVCITEKGHREAEEMALYISSTKAKELEGIPCIYVSRLQRAIQTAYPLALKLGLPLMVSSGISTCALCVRKCIEKSMRFEFFKLDELQSMCKGVELIDVDDKYHPLHVPTKSWRKAIETIAMRSDELQKPLIIVGHRELNRNVVGNKNLKTPPCGISYIKATKSEVDLTDDGIDNDNDNHNHDKKKSQNKFHYELLEHTKFDGTPSPLPVEK